MIENILAHPVDKIICSREQPQKYFSCSIWSCALVKVLCSLYSFHSCPCDRGGTGVRSFLCMKRFRRGSDFHEGRVHILFIVLSSVCSSVICKCLSGEIIVQVNKAEGKWLAQGHANGKTQDLSLLIPIYQILLTHPSVSMRGAGQRGSQQGLGMHTGQGPSPNHFIFLSLGFPICNVNSPRTSF